MKRKIYLIYIPLVGISDFEARGGTRGFSLHSSTHSASHIPHSLLPQSSIKAIVQPVRRGNRPLGVAYRISLGCCSNCRILTDILEWPSWKEFKWFATVDNRSSETSCLSKDLHLEADTLKEDNFLRLNLPSARLRAGFKLKQMFQLAFTPRYSDWVLT